MPPWVESVLAVLGDPRFISLVALGLSVWSLIRTRQLTALQTQLAAFQLKDREHVEAARTKADVRARLSPSGRNAHRIDLSNQQGAAPATEVDIEFLEVEEDALLPEGERRDKLPIPHLEPGESVKLVVFLGEKWPPFKFALSWKDPDGTPRRREDILYLS